MADKKNLGLAERAADPAERLAAANHALRTPLASIIAALELLQDAALSRSGGTRQSLVATALASAERLAMVVEQWLDMERLDAGAVAMVNRPLELSSLVSALVAELARPGRARLQFTPPACGACARMSGDPERLRQALSHLIVAALERSAPRSEVSLKLDVKEKRVVLTVEDGAPHPAAGDLGLVIAGVIVKRSGGSLAVERRAEEGTRLTIDFPRLRDDAAT
jgi:two-component system sensor histidine kinase KdpD